VLAGGWSAADDIAMDLEWSCFLGVCVGGGGHGDERRDLKEDQVATVIPWHCCLF
jgi:hypothetical protein